MPYLLYPIYILIFPGILWSAAAGLVVSGIDRKLTARMQRRIGPPILQPFYDFMKLLGKETIVPRAASRGVFLASPWVALVSVLTVALFIPVFGFTAFGNTADLIVILYLLTLAAVALIIGGASSGSPFAGVGISRGVVSLIAYELPLVIVILAVAKAAGGDGVTFSMQRIAEYQSQNGILLFDLKMLPAAIAMLLVIPCEVGSHPFDIAEAGTEICEGPLVEYSGRPLAIFKLSHSVKQYVMAALFSALFVGGHATGFVPLDALLFLALTVVVTTISTTILNAVCGRFKVEQLFKFYWMLAAPLALISLVLAFVL